MNLTAPSEVKALLDRLDFKPSKVLGQNFLIDVNILKIMLTTAALHPSDAVLEIGPGLGVLTEWLARWAGRVVAIEKDKKLFAYLRERLAATSNIELIEADALSLDLESFFAGGINKVVSNLPYSVGSRLLVNMVEAQHAPEQIVVTVQKEVADRLAAKSGTKDYGFISVMAQTRYEVSVRKEISPTCFMPSPEVKSAIVNLNRRDEAGGEDPEARARLRELVKKAFSHRRKQLLPMLRPELGGSAAARLEQIGIREKSRPEDLTPNQWTKLSELLRPS